MHSQSVTCARAPRVTFKTRGMAARVLSLAPCSTGLTDTPSTGGRPACHTDTDTNVSARSKTNAVAVEKAVLVTDH